MLCQNTNSNNFFEFSCQSKKSNQFAGFFLSKHRFKWIYLILPIKTQNSTQFSRFFLSKSKFDLKKYDKRPVNIDKIDFFCQNTNSKKFIWIFMSKQKFKSVCWIFLVKTQMQMNLFDFTCQNTKFNSIFWIFPVKKQIWFEKIW